MARLVKILVVLVLLALALFVAALVVFYLMLPRFVGGVLQELEEDGYAVRATPLERSLKGLGMEARMGSLYFATADDGLQVTLEDITGRLRLGWKSRLELEAGAGSGVRYVVPEDPATAESDGQPLIFRVSPQRLRILMTHELFSEQSHGEIKAADVRVFGKGLPLYEGNVVRPLDFSNLKGTLLKGIPTDQLPALEGLFPRRKGEEPASPSEPPADDLQRTIDRLKDRLKLPGIGRRNGTGLSHVRAERATVGLRPALWTPQNDHAQTTKVQSVLPEERGFEPIATAEDLLVTVALTEPSEKKSKSQNVRVQITNDSVSVSVNKNDPPNTTPQNVRVQITNTTVHVKNSPLNHLLQWLGWNDDALANLLLDNVLFDVSAHVNAPIDTMDQLCRALRTDQASITLNRLSVAGAGRLVSMEGAFDHDGGNRWQGSGRLQFTPSGENLRNAPMDNLNLWALLGALGLNDVTIPYRIVGNALNVDALGLEAVPLPNSANMAPYCAAARRWEEEKR